MFFPMKTSVCVCVCVVMSVRLCDPVQGFSRQEYWSGLPFLLASNLTSCCIAFSTTCVNLTWHNTLKTHPKLNSFRQSFSWTCESAGMVLLKRLGAPCFRMSFNSGIWGGDSRQGHERASRNMQSFFRGWDREQ